MYVVNTAILALGVGYLQAGPSTDPITYRMVMQAAIFVAVGAAGLVMTILRRWTGAGVT